MSFLASYQKYCSEFTDSPTIFHHRIGLSILSSVVGRKVYMKQGYKNVFPNLWLIVVAPSSFYRKSYSLGIAEDILRKVGEHIFTKFILPREFSHEKLIEIMAEQPQGLLVFYEFKTFMALMSREYMAGTQSFLTEIFDTPTLYDRKTKTGTHEIKEPFLNILSATTIDWLKNSIQDTDMSGGFLPRFLIVAWRGKKEEIMPFQPPANMDKRENLIEKLVKISELAGEATLTDAAKAWYVSWYVKFEEKWGFSSSLSPFYARIQEYAKKLAILIAIDEKCSLLIEENHMATACRLAEAFATEITEIVDENLAYTDINQKKVVDAIRVCGNNGISREELIRKTRLIADRQLNPILNTFIESNQVKVVENIIPTVHGNSVKKKIYFWNNGNYMENE